MLSQTAPFPASRGKVGQGPKFLTCFRCGEKYGDTSLSIHQTRCAKLWEQREALKPKHERRPVPATPEALKTLPNMKDAQAVEEWNNKAFDFFNARSLVRCPGCNRSFTESALQHHLKGCEKGAEAVESKERARKAAIKGPAFLLCYICGRKYGSTSLAIHVENCKALWTERESQKPKSQRRPLPKPPQLGGADGLAATAPLSGDDALDAYNDAAFASYNAALVKCPYCPRTFNETALKHHVAHCGKGQPQTATSATSLAAPSRDQETRRHSTGALIMGDKSSPHRTPTKGSARQSGSLSVSPKQPVSLVCCFCGRKYGSSSFGLHQPKCRSMWLERESTKPTHQRRKLPSAPAKLLTVPSPLTPASMEEFNDEAFAFWNEITLIRCQKCNRTFNEEAHAIHIKRCDPEAAAAADGPKPNAKMPRMISCHICGRGYSNASLPIHVKNCEKQWEAAESKKPLHKRRAIPRAPAVPIDASLGQASLEAYNNAASEAFNDNLEPCNRCGRTFLPDRLVVHARSCRGMR